MGLPVTLRWLHGYPKDLENHPMGPGVNNKRLGYTLVDVSRFAKEYELPFALPPRVDVDWAFVDAAFWYANAHGVGPGFARLASMARFGLGEDLEDETTLRRIATELGLDGDGMLAAAALRTPDEVGGTPNDPESGEKVFGVPTFVYAGELFWGNDRIDWLTRAIKARTNA